MRLLISLSVIGGFVLILFGAVNYRLASRAHEVPQVITCDKLIRQGPGSNIHVIVTDFSLHTNAFVVLGKKGTDLHAHWNVAYIPVSPSRGNSTGNRQSYGLILQTGRAQEPSELGALGADGQLHGIIINSVTSLDSKARELLTQRYPDTDFSKCLILAHEKSPPAMQTAMMQLGGGGGLVVICLMVGMLQGAAGRRRERSLDMEIDRDMARRTKAVF